MESRVIVDTRSFLKYTSNSKKVKDVKGNDGKTLMASEFSLDHLSMCSPILEGYCLKTKTWCKLLQSRERLKLTLVCRSL